MPASLTGRIVGAFALLAIALWLAIGATMFVVLRGLHADATSSSLADIAQTFAVRIRAAAVDREVGRSSTRSGTRSPAAASPIQLLASDGTTVEIGATDPEPVEPIVIPATTKIGDTLTGLAPFTDGDQHDYAALVLRGPNAAVYRAVLLSTVDTSGAAALRDVTRTLPIVILATVLVGAPMAVAPVALGRPAAGPPAAAPRASSSIRSEPPAEPLPAAGPREVRELTERVNVLARRARPDPGPRERAARRPAPRPPDAADRHRRLRDGPGRRHRDRRGGRAGRGGDRRGDDAIWSGWSASSARSTGSGPAATRSASSRSTPARCSRPRSSGSPRRPRRPA